MSDEALRQADELLTELIETIETARALPMSTSCVVPREHVLDLLDELREVLPPEMDEARKLIARRDALLHEAYETAVATRERAVAEADAVIADAQHRASELLASAEAESGATLDAAREQHAQMVASTAVHQAAVAAASALRDDAERYQQQVAAEAQQYDAHVRTEADAYAGQARAEAERYASRLTADAEDYAERTLDELAAVLHRAAQTADQGRSALARRRANAFTATDGADSADNLEKPAVEPERRGRRRQMSA